MTKGNKQRHGYQNFLHLGDMLHHMEGGFVAACDWLSGPAMSKKDRVEHKLAESEPVRRAGHWGF